MPKCPHTLKRWKCRRLTVDEAKQAISAGFDYVAEKNGIMLFRRPKGVSKNI